MSTCQHGLFVDEDMGQLYHILGQPLEHFIRELVLYITLVCTKYNGHYHYVCNSFGRYRKYLVGGEAQWLERQFMTGKLSLACAMTCS